MRAVDVFAGKIDDGFRTVEKFHPVARVFAVPVASRTPSGRSRGERVKTTTSKLREQNSFASARPMKPLPPAMTMRGLFMAGLFLQHQLRDIFRRERVDLESASFQLPQPAGNEPLHRRKI